MPRRVDNDDERKAGSVSDCSEEEEDGEEQDSDESDSESESEESESEESENEESENEESDDASESASESRERKQIAPARSRHGRSRQPVEHIAGLNRSEFAAGNTVLARYDRNHKSLARRSRWYPGTVRLSIQTARVQSTMPMEIPSRTCQPST